jgi:hypothetical protein
MSIRQFATDSIFFRRNDEAIDEFARLGFKLSDKMARVLKVVDGRRTFKQVVAHPSIVMDQTSSDSIRSLIKLGFIEAVPVPSTASTASTASNISADTNQPTPDNDSDAQINATQRLRVIAVAGEKEISKTQTMQALNTTPAERDQWQREVEARQLEEIKSSLLLELRRVLGKDVELIQMKIIAVTSAEELLHAVGVCSRILEVAISKETADKFVATFKQHFIS